MTAHHVTDQAHETVSRFTFEEMTGLLRGIADVGGSHQQRWAIELQRRLHALTTELVDLITDDPEEVEVPAHETTPTFRMTGPGDGTPTGFECDGCPATWTVAPGQDASDLIPILRQHAAEAVANA